MVWAISRTVLRKIMKPPELATYLLVDIHKVKVLV
jgi:hypothetical protein